MRSTVLIAAVLLLAGAPAMACDYDRSVSTPAPEQVVMSPIPAPVDGAVPGVGLVVAN